MNLHDLAKNISFSLTLGSWSRTVIGAVLERRLPVAVHKLVPHIVDALVTAMPGPFAPSAARVAQALVDDDSFYRIWRYCIRRRVFPAPDLNSPAMAPTAAFLGLDVPQLATLEQLADWLLIPAGKLDYLADLQNRYESHSDAAVHHYHYTQIKKKAGGLRLIEAPKSMLKSVQRQILNRIIEKAAIHKDSFGFTKGKSCIDGANRHASEEVVISFDLKDFFPSIGKGRVFGFFRCLGYPHTVATYLAALCTNVPPSSLLNQFPYNQRAIYRAPHLPQGAPTSPALANMVSYRLDRRLSALARLLGANYSRYADDFSFSGDRHITGLLMRAVPQIVKDEGFLLNAAKTRIMRNTTRQVVTGIVVNQHLNVTRTHFDQLKAIIHACRNKHDNRLGDARFRMSLAGKIAWVETVNPKKGTKLRHLLSEAWQQYCDQTA